MGSCNNYIYNFRHRCYTLINTYSYAYNITASPLNNAHPGGFFYFWERMPTDFTITAKNNPDKFKDVVFKDGKSTYSFDFSPWAEDNHDIATATWETRSGNLSISGEALTDNVATALVSFTESGRNLLKVTAATASNEVYIAYLDIYVKDPQVVACGDDYGLYS